MDMISRQAAIEPKAISEWKKEFREYVDSLDITRDDWKGIIEYIDEIPSAQPEHTETHSCDCEHTETHDLVSREAAIDVLDTGLWGVEWDKALATAMLKDLPSAQPERMTNRQWVDFLSAQFDISRTSAKEMLHGMMRWKKEDNFKKMFNGGKT